MLCSPQWKVMNGPVSWVLLGKQSHSVGPQIFTERVRHVLYCIDRGDRVCVLGKPWNGCISAADCGARCALHPSSAQILQWRQGAEDLRSTRCFLTQHTFALVGDMFGFLRLHLPSLLPNNLCPLYILWDQPLLWLVSATNIFTERVSGTAIL